MKVQLAKQYNEKNILALINARRAWASYKIDGVRGIVTYEHGVVSVTSREGKPLPGLAQWCRALEAELPKEFENNHLGKCVWDGEFSIPGMTFQKACGVIRSHAGIEASRIKFTCFQTLMCYGEDYTSWSFAHRSDVNMIPLSFSTCEEWSVDSLEDLQSLYEQARARGYEGLIIKDCGQAHVEGKKNGWYKMKPEDDIDGRVVGFEQLYSEVEKCMLPMVGSLILEYEDGTAGKVGTGMTDQQRISWYDDSTQIVGHLIRVKFMERTDDGNLRHPSFDGFRDTPEFPGVKL